MPRPASAWEKPPLARAPDGLPVGLGDPWGNRPKASFPVEVRPAKPFLERTPSGTNGLLVAAVVLSLSLHAFGIGTIVIANVLDDFWGPPDAPAAAGVMEIFDLADFPELSRQVKEMARIPGVNEKIEEVEPEPPRDTKGQIVQLAKPESPETARDDAKYRSEFDRRVEQETVAKDQALTPGVVADDFKGLGKDPSSSKDPFAGDAKTQLAVIGPRRGDAGNDGSLNPDDGKPISEMLDTDPFGIRAKKVESRPRQFAGAPGRPGGAIDEPGAGAEVAMAGAPNNDYLPAVRPGDRTALNAKRDFFASFWLRVQGQVEGPWSRRVQNVRPGQIQKRDYFTRVNVTLAPNGSLVAVDIVQRCGIAGWDAAVVDAFAEAAPFLNPPRGLIEADGNIHMEDLGFIVSLTGGKVVHMYGDPRSGKLFPGMNEGGSLLH